MRRPSQRDSPAGGDQPRGLAPERLHALVEEYRRTGDRRVRNVIVEAHLHLVDHYVIVYTRPGLASRDDVRQTALVALIGAVDRFDPDGGASLPTFATRSIDGELKRYLRDRTWMVRPPRSAQETHLNLRRAADDLAQTLGRSPTLNELAMHLGVDEERVIIGLVAGNARTNESFDRPSGDEGMSVRMEAALGREDAGFDHAESIMCLVDGVDRLDERQRRILEMRFGQEMSQPQIAEVIGVSQSYVSRIIESALTVLRSEFA